MSLVNRKGEQFIRAVSVSSGIAIAKIQFIASEIDEINVGPKACKSNEMGWQQLIQKAKRQLGRQIKSYSGGKAEGSILSAHLEILKDEGFQNFVTEQLKGGATIRQALELMLEQWKDKFKHHKSALYRDRILDMQDVVLRLLKLCHAIPNTCSWADASCIYTRQALPSSLVEVPADKLKAVVCQDVSMASHLAILARARGVPCLSRVRLPHVCDQSVAIIDGCDGWLVLNPTEATLLEYRRKISSSLTLEDTSKTQIPRPGHLRYWANVDSWCDVQTLPSSGYEGIGLVRTEYLAYENGRLPSVRTQVEYYKRLARSQSGKEVVIRLFDFGSDKPYSQQVARELNPALGCRGVRFLLKEQMILKDQLTALLQASKEGPISIMVPMVCQPHQMQQVRALMTQLADRLHLNHLPKLGMMVEVPAAALMLEQYGEHSDFFSIGSNDLLQYTHAVDRTNSQVQELYNPMSTALLNLIYMIIQSAKRMRKPVSLCGEMAVDSACRQSLEGMGLHDFSISPKALRQALGLNN